MKTKATVTITVEVKDLGPWADGCTAEQIRNQASAEAVSKVSRVLHERGSGCAVVSNSARVILLQTELDQPK